MRKISWRSDVIPVTHTRSESSHPNGERITRRISKLQKSTSVIGIFSHLKLFSTSNLINALTHLGLSLLFSYFLYIWDAVKRFIFVLVL